MKNHNTSKPDLPVTIRVNEFNWGRFGKAARRNSSNASKEVRAFVARYNAKYYRKKKTATG